MKLSFNYSISANMLDLGAEFFRRIEMMKKAGVETVWLYGYFYGYFDATTEKMEKAKSTLEAGGFNVQVLSVPLGHGGNALAPGDETVNLNIGRGWRMTVGIDGTPRKNTTCIDCGVIADTRKAVDIFKQLGLTKVFYDDDLRFGRWGKELNGCFCPQCMEEFSGIYGKTTRDDLARDDNELQNAWMDFSCSKITGFLKGVKLEGITNGVMVMHNGDRRHGIDITKIKAEMPDTLFRVGEGHFSDKSFLHPLGKKSILTSIHTHMALAGGQSYCYSESTTFPVGSLSPSNMINKIELEISAGLRNIFLMGGTIFLWDDYWTALAENLPRLRTLADQTPEPKHDVSNFIWQN